MAVSSVGDTTYTSLATDDVDATSDSVGGVDRSNRVTSPHLPGKSYKNQNNFFQII